MAVELSTHIMCLLNNDILILWGLGDATDVKAKNFVSIMKFAAGK